MFKPVKLKLQQANEVACRSENDWCKAIAFFDLPDFYLGLLTFSIVSSLVTRREKVIKIKEIKYCQNFGFTVIDK
ncbi:MAG: hypothetical protein IPN49_17120 [Saprospiraceae bacterium]|nr:hypothetical protein [Saprospiraceae bacterium]